MYGSRRGLSCGDGGVSSLRARFREGWSAIETWVEPKVTVLSTTNDATAGVFLRLEMAMKLSCISVLHHHVLRTSDMAREEPVRLLIAGGIGVIAQIAIYGLYTDDVAFYLDGYTTSLVQIVFVAVFMAIIYRPLFYCHASQITTRQRLFGGLMVTTYFMLTASRLPIPPWPLALCAIAGVTTERKRAVLLRFLVAGLIIAGGRLVVGDALATSKMGITFWDQTINQQTLFVIYVLIGGVFTFALFLLAQVRTKRLHTAQFVLNTFVGGSVWIAIIWGFTWIPGLTMGNVRFPTSEVDAGVEVITYVIFAAFLKLIIIATAIEFIKFGHLFNYLALSASAYMVFPMMTSLALDGIMPMDSIVGLILLVFGILISMMLVLFCEPAPYLVTEAHVDLSCDECRRSKTWLGCMHAPSFVWGSTPHAMPPSATEDEEEDERNSHPLETLPVQFTLDDADEETQTRALPHRGTSERNVFDVLGEATLEPPLQLTADSGV